MKVIVQYSVVFGKMDQTDFSPWEIDLSAQEEKMYRAIVASDLDPNNEPDLKSVLNRAHDQIEEYIDQINEELGEEFEDGWRIIVQFE